MHGILCFTQCFLMHKACSDVQHDGAPAAAADADATVAADAATAEAIDA